MIHGHQTTALKAARLQGRSPACSDALNLCLEGRVQPCSLCQARQSLSPTGTCGGAALHCAEVSGPALSLTARGRSSTRSLSVRTAQPHAPFLKAALTVSGLEAFVQFLQLAHWFPHDVSAGLFHGLLWNQWITEILATLKGKARRPSKRPAQQEHTCPSCSRSGSDTKRSCMWRRAAAQRNTKKPSSGTADQKWTQLHTQENRLTLPTM